MTPVAATDSLSNFQRNTRAHLEELHRTGEPELLTVEGRPGVVVQDAAAYEAMLSRLEQLEAVTGIQRGIDSAKAGKGRTLDEFVTEMRRKHSIAPAA
jgi:PHD/YefM family antitoxin component YafN of YafNO toxin-antitoxin module